MSVLFVLFVSAVEFQKTTSSMPIGSRKRRADSAEPTAPPPSKKPDAIKPSFGSDLVPTVALANAGSDFTRDQVSLQRGSAATAPSESGPSEARQSEATPQHAGVDEAVLEATMLSILERRKPGATCCPSEVPRALPIADWRAWMEATRRVARRLARDGVVEILQRGSPVRDADNVRGPIRLRLRRQS